MTAPRYLTYSLTTADDDGIGLSQTPGAAGNMLINGALASGGVATMDNQRVVLFTFAGDESTHTFVVYGTDGSGRSIQESVAGTTPGTVSTVGNFKTVIRISISAAATGAIKVGTSGVGSTPWQPINWDANPINLGIAVLVSGTVNYTWQYTFEDSNGYFPYPLAATSGYINTETPQRAITKFPTAFDLTALAAKAVDTDSVLTVPVAAWRLKINSGTGTATVCIIQSGIQGGS